MSTILSQAEHVARKAYRCNAFEVIAMGGFDDGQYSYAELREIVKVRRQLGLIQPGQKYVRQVYVMDGDFCVVRYLPAMWQIVKDHDLYEGG